MKDKKEDTQSIPQNLACILHTKRLDDLDQKTSNIQTDISEIKDKLFISNGNPSWSERLRSIESFIASLKKHIWILYASLVAILLENIFKFGAEIVKHLSQHN